MAKKTSYLFENVWTIPNLLSFLRIIMVPIFAVLFAKGWNEPVYLFYAVGVLALSGLSDFFDGKIARRFNQISELGKILDPIADKLTQVTLAVMLFITFFRSETPSIKAFAWVFLLFILKEMVMLIGGAAMIYLGMKPGAAEIFGKAATMAFYLIMIAIVAFGPEIGAFVNLWNCPCIPAWLMMVLVVIAVIMTFVAFFSYVPGIRRQAKERFSPEGKAKWREEKLKKKENKK